MWIFSNDITLQKSELKRRKLKWWEWRHRWFNEAWTEGWDRTLISATMRVVTIATSKWTSRKKWKKKNLTNTTTAFQPKVKIIHLFPLLQLKGKYTKLIDNSTIISTFSHFCLQRIASFTWILLKVYLNNLVPRHLSSNRTFVWRKKQSFCSESETSQKWRGK